MYHLLRFASFFLVGCFVGLLVYFELSFTEMIMVTVICGSILYFLTTLSFTDLYVETLLLQHGLGNIFEDANGYNLTGENYPGFSTIYGEIFASGVKKIRDLAVVERIDTFLDMGSGIGKAVIIAKLCGFKHAIGVEVVKSRHLQALSVLRKMPPNKRERIELINGDMFEFDFSQFNKPIVIFSSNLVWSKETTKDFFRMVGKQCPKGTIVVCSMFHFHEEDAYMFKKHQMIYVPMSWDWQSTCYVFRVV